VCGLICYQKGVVPLALKDGSSKNVEWKDVAGNLVAFEAINGCRLEIRMSTADYHGRADLAVEVLAHDRKVETGDQPSLASVRLTCSGSRLKTLEALLIHALYQLDFQLGERAFADAVKQS